MKQLAIGIVILCVSGGFASPIISHAQGAETPKLEVPDTLEEAKGEAVLVGEDIAAELPAATKEIFQTEVIPVWQRMFTWTREALWKGFLLPPFENIWGDVMALLGQEVERRKPIIEQELEKEKQELKEDLQGEASKTGQTLWERFQALFQEDE